MALLCTYDIIIATIIRNTYIDSKRSKNHLIRLLMSFKTIIVSGTTLHSQFTQPYIILVLDLYAVYAILCSSHTYIPIIISNTFIQYHCILQTQQYICSLVNLQRSPQIFSKTTTCSITSCHKDLRIHTFNLQ